VGKGIVAATEAVALEFLIVETYPDLEAVTLTVMVLFKSDRETT
jgi:hypothetical protein